MGVWLAEQQEVKEEALDYQTLLFLHHTDIPSDVSASQPGRANVTRPTKVDFGRKRLEKPSVSEGSTRRFSTYVGYVKCARPTRGDTGWLAMEPTGVPWHKRFVVINLSIPELLSAPPPRSPKAAGGTDNGGPTAECRLIRGSIDGRFRQPVLGERGCV